MEFTVVFNYLFLEKAVLDKAAFFTQKNRTYYQAQSFTKPQVIIESTQKKTTNKKEVIMSESVSLLSGKLYFI